MSGGNPIAAITDPISKAIGTDGSGGGILGAVEQVGKGISKVGVSIDKGITQPIGKGLAQVDKFVGREIPGGWTTVGLAAAAAAAPYASSYLAAQGAGTTSAAGLAGGGAFVPAAGSGASFVLPSAAATTAASGAAGISTEIGKEAFFQAISNGATSSEAISAGLAADTAGNAAALQLTTEAGKEAFFQTLAKGGTSSEAMTAGLSTESLASLGSTPVFDKSAYKELTPGGNPIARGATATEMAALDASQQAAGVEALAKYGGGMSTGQKAMLGMNAARGLLGQRPQPQQQPQMMVGRQTNPAGAVDYSGLLNLLSARPTNRNSLLG